MPVYMFTYHSYGSWLPNRAEGFVHKRDGLQPTNTALARRYRTAMKHEAVYLSPQQQRVLIAKTLDLCKEKSYRLHGAACSATHLHVIVSWNSEVMSWRMVSGRIKNLNALALSRHAGTTGRPWFVEGKSRKRIRDREHLNYLLKTYLPRHRGLQWYEGRGWVNAD